MVPEEAAFFRSEKPFASGISGAFNREAGRRALRKPTGGLQETRDVARAVCSSNVEHGGIIRRVSKGGECAIHVPGKQLRVSLSLGGRSQPVFSLAGSSSGQGLEAHSPGPIALAVPETSREGAGAPDRSTLTRGARHPPYRRGAL